MNTAPLADDQRLYTSAGTKCLPALPLTWIAPLGHPVSRATTFDLISRFSADSDQRHLGYSAGQAFETTELTYEHFLGVLPPLAYRGGSFACGEMTTDTLVDSYHQAEGRFFCVTVEWRGSDTLYQAWAAILRDLVLAR